MITCSAFCIRGLLSLGAKAWDKIGNPASLNTPTTSFETFPFPEPNEQQNIAVANAAKELNELRENWLNPAGVDNRTCA